MIHEQLKNITECFNTWCNDELWSGMEVCHYKISNKAKRYV